ncbi:DsrE family protein [Hydrogenothermus marinus]|uniref:Uncharacterized protein n=1 Tax=Hydrogenothermus marinus TaxID=133270 RepID=A0A3M0BLI1_9AQUI|nr:DsrE family protein [Hydrogenothermus marinus]RMA97129.1 hypothetical protein CLV39_0784 [Hydrogenothermus marinus]
MKKVLFFLLVLIFSSYAKDNEVRKVVFDLRTGDIKKFENTINGIAKHIDYYESQFKTLKVVIVAHGDSYKFFLKDLSKTPYKNDKELLKKQKLLYERLKNLHDFYKVKFEICKLGMEARHLDISNLYPFVKPVYSALVGLVEWQNKGYAYMPIF